MQKLTKIFRYIFWGSNALLLLAIHLFQGRLNSDNGIFLSGAWSLANNFNIYKDFFSFTTPGAYYLILMVWKIFGINYWVAWATGLSMLLISSFLIFKITSLLNRRAAYLAVILFTLSTIGWPIITSHIFCLPFILSAIYFAIIGINESRINYIYLSGVLAGLSVLFLQTIGLATFISIFIFLILSFFSKKNNLKIKNIILFILYFLFSISIIFLKWSPAVLFNSLIKFPLVHYSETISSNYWFLGTFFILCILAYLALYKNHKISPAINLLFIFQDLLFLTTLSFPDLAHLTFICAPLLILFSTLTIELFEFKIKKKFYGIFSLIFIFFIYFIFNIFLAFTYTYHEKLEKINKTPDLILFLKTNCGGKYIYAGPFIPEFYFETRTLNPGPTHWLLTNHHTGEQFSETLHALEDKKPECVILNYNLVKKLHYNLNNPVDNYIKSYYKSIFELGGTNILKRAE